MSRREFEPGTVAAITTRANRDVECAAVLDDRGQWTCKHRTTAPDDILTTRPLVVIDPEDREAVERLHTLWCKAITSAATSARQIDSMQAALREFANPTPPVPEPTAVGSIIHDTDGEAWVRNSSGEWICLHSRYGVDPALRWADLTSKYGPVEVRS